MCTQYVNECTIFLESSEVLFQDFKHKKIELDISSSPFTVDPVEIPTHFYFERLHGNMVSIAMVFKFIAIIRLL